MKPNYFATCCFCLNLLCAGSHQVISNASRSKQNLNHWLQGQYGWASACNLVEFIATFILEWAEMDGSIMKDFSSCLKECIQSSRKCWIVTAHDGLQHLQPSWAPVAKSNPLSCQTLCQQCYPFQHWRNLSKKNTMGGNIFDLPISFERLIPSLFFFF